MTSSLFDVVSSSVFFPRQLSQKSPLVTAPIALERPEVSLLVRELLDLQVKITIASHGIYGAWREVQDDHLVLATAVSCMSQRVWVAESQVDRLWW